jgi:exodeoxyribonuclease VII large subunit
LARVILSPAQVQGTDAPSSIAAALDLLNEHGEADVAIVGRGGGSVEELWAFNDEIVARAIARSRIPIISGVGHETDFTIADFVADYRASTPTAAATAAVPNIEDWRIDILDKQQILLGLIQKYKKDLYVRIERTQRDLERVSPRRLIKQRRQQLDDSMERLQTHIGHINSLHAERLRGAVLQLHSLSPLLTIARGYAIVRRDDNQKIISQVEDVQPGEYLTIQVQDGSIPVEVRK